MPTAGGRGWRAGGLTSAKLGPGLAERDGCPGGFSPGLRKAAALCPASSLLARVQLCVQASPLSSGPSLLAVSCPPAWRSVLQPLRQGSLQQVAGCALVVPGHLQSRPAHGRGSRCSWCRQVRLGVSMPAGEALEPSVSSQPRVRPELLSHDCFLLGEDREALEKRFWHRKLFMSTRGPELERKA